MSTEKRYMVSCSFESPRHAHPVQEKLLRGFLPAMEQATSIKTVGIAPCHQNLPSFPMRLVTTVTPSYRGTPIPMELAQDRDDHRWFYLLARNDDGCRRLGEPPYFNGRPDNLYQVSDQGDAENARLLLRDVLLFSAAVRLAVRLLVADIPCTWLLKEWQGAACILGGARTAHDRFHLILSSSHDSVPVSPELLRDFGIDPETCSGPGNCPTILERAIRLLPSK